MTRPGNTRSKKNRVPSGPVFGIELPRLVCLLDDLLYLLNFGNEVFEQVLDTVLQGRRR